MGIARNSRFNICVDFKRSHDSYLFDKNTGREYLDFFGMYASLPLGYNHNIFKTDEFCKELLGAASFKINNCEFVSDETLEFDKLFRDYAGKGIYKHFHYSCTGALAVEAAIKTCAEYEGHSDIKVLSFNNSFHGVNGYGGFTTSKFYPASKKLENLPQPFSVKIDLTTEQVLKALTKNDITCILVEPIQCSSGDIHHQESMFREIYKMARAYDVPVIHDEIQIGFGGTGKLWHFEHLDMVPDLVVFGKKTQLSGIMVKEKFGKIFSKDRRTKLEVTWDADALDMIRCKYIIKAYKKYDILKNVSTRANELVSELSKDSNIHNLRNKGLIVGFDLSSTSTREEAVYRMKENGIICNVAGSTTIRLRPNLAITQEEVKSAIEIIRQSVREVERC